MDYYYDNLFQDARWKAFAFTVVAFHTKNFSFDDYDAIIWSGNFKAGPSLKPSATSAIVPYALVDWTAVPEWQDRFFENFLRAGAGVRWYPRTVEPDTFGTDLLRRLHLFGEYVGNVAWLGDEPERHVEGHDIRFGVALSTGGFFRDRRR